MTSHDHFIDFDKTSIYDLHNNDEIIDELNIEIGSGDLAPFNCANHKLDNSIRGAILKHPIVSQNLKIINKFCVDMRNVTEFNVIFVELKCRLKLENDTRWGSAFLALEIVKIAFNRGAFNSVDFQISIKTVEMYLMILRPAYILNLTFESLNSSIADHIPQINNLLQQWDKMKTKVSTHGQQFISLLQDEIKTRFAKELNSKIHCV